MSYPMIDNVDNVRVDYTGEGVNITPVKEAFILRGCVYS